MKAEPCYSLVAQGAPTLPREGAERGPHRSPQLI